MCLRLRSERSACNAAALGPTGWGGKDRADSVTMCSEEKMIQVDFPKTCVQRGTHNEEMKTVPFVTYLHLKRLFGETDTSSVSYINTKAD